MAEWGQDWGNFWGCDDVDHKAEILARFTERWRNKPDFKKLMCIFADRWQNVQHVYGKIEVMHHIDNAEGVQLDVVGRRINLPRLAETDADYKQLLKIQALLIYPDKTTDDGVVTVSRSLLMFEVIRTIMGDDIRDVDFLEQYPLGGRLQIDGLTAKEEEQMLRFLPKTRPVTYDLSLVTATLDGFQFDSELGTPLDGPGSGFGSTIQPALGGPLASIKEIS